VELTELASRYNRPLNKLPSYTRNKYAYLGKLLNKLLKNKPFIVEFGSGNTLLAKNILLPYLEQKNPKYIGIDNNELLNPPPDLLSDITQTNLPDKTADCIICLDVLEHLNDENHLNKAIQEMVRVVKDEGLIVVVVPSMYNLDRFNHPEIDYGTHRIKMPPDKWELILNKFINISITKGIGLAETIRYLPLFLKFGIKDFPALDKILKKSYTFFNILNPGVFDHLFYKIRFNNLPVIKNICDGYLIAGYKKQ